MTPFAPILIPGRTPLKLARPSLREFPLERTPKGPFQMDDESKNPAMTPNAGFLGDWECAGLRFLNPKHRRSARSNRRRILHKVVTVLIGWTILAGCTASEKRVDPFFVRNPFLGPMTIAVAPAINLSGSIEFDRNRFADLMAVELSYADGITVIPVSRVLGVLSVQGRDAVESPTHAGTLAQSLGADAILVFAVTRYDPYDPPSIGLTAQLYAARTPPGLGATAQGEVPSPQPGSAGNQRGDSAPLLAQSSAVHDAAHAAVAADIAEFAQNRNADNSPYGWRKFVVSQQGFMQYCCYATIRSLLGGERYTASVGESSER